MLNKHETRHGSWMHQQTFVLATTGAAIGLANFWRFPYLMAENGGLWFLGCYVLCLLFLGFPLLYAEILLGRMGRRSPAIATRMLAAQAGGRRLWGWSGALGTLAGLLTLALYAVVSGMTLAYVFKAAFGDFVGATPANVAQQLATLSSNTQALFVWELIFMLGVLVVLVRGVNKGIERATRYLIPLFFLILTGLLFVASQKGDMDAAKVYLFNLATDKVSWRTFLYAAQHAFFTLGIGMGAMMAFGAYAPSSMGLVRPLLYVVGLDLLVSVLAGFVVFPLLVVAHLPLTQGFDLVFQAAPLAFSTMRDGQFFAAMFFVLLTFAAWSSAIALGEPLVAFFVERLKCARFWAVSLVLIVTICLAQLVTNSLGHWSLHRWYGISPFSLYDLAVSGVVIPAAALLMVCFVGWVLSPDKIKSQMTSLERRWFYPIWHFLLRYIAPLFVLLLVVMAVSHFVASACDNLAASEQKCTWLEFVEPRVSAPASDVNVTVENDSATGVEANTEAEGRAPEVEEKDDAAAIAVQVNAAQKGKSD